MKIKQKFGTYICHFRLNTFLLLCLLSITLPLKSSAQPEEPTPKIRLDTLPGIPSLSEGQKSIGYAGMLGGIHNDVIIAAGGANFPENPPWKGGTKKWYDHIYFFINNRWEISTAQLAYPLGYAACVSSPKGIICTGGDNNNFISNITLLLQYDPGIKEINIDTLPPLPTSLAYHAAVYTDDFLYVIGGKNEKGSTNYFYRLHLNSSTEWERLPDFPGPPRALHTAVVQDDASTKRIYVFGGRNEQTDKKSEALSDFISYDLNSGTWKTHGNIEINGKNRVIMGAVAKAEDAMHILIYGGSDEILFDQIEQLTLDEKNTADDLKKGILSERRNAILNNHPGFSSEILSYNTITEHWYKYDSLDIQLPVTTLALNHADDLFLISGETAPGIRTPAVLKFSYPKNIKQFGRFNYIVLFLYLLISLFLGVYFSKKQKSTNDYFKGGGRIPWWASGLSVFGTLLSAITFMAIPAKSFATDWSYFLLNMAAIAITPLIAVVFIPYFNSLKITTAYQYLEDRFNYVARAFGSLSFILFQLGRIGIVLLLPSLAISIVTGISVEASILLMGIICIVYTTFGGIEAVIWTDVLQVIVLLGGSIVAIVILLYQAEMPFSEMITFAKSRQKFNLVDMRFNFTDTTFWVVFIGGLASAMVTQGTDQTVVQRYLTSSDVKDSQKTLYTNAILTFPASIIFFGIGTLLFIFYSQNPDRLSPGISNIDSIFPWYIVNELPMGLSGLLIAGIFSAAMSSASSSLNSVSTAFCNDFYKKIKPKGKDDALLKVARIATILTGIIGILLAFWMANSNIKSLWDQFYRFLGLFTGGLGGMFLLGLLTKRANTTGTMIGLVVSALCIWYVSTYTTINFLMYSFLGVVSCFLSGYFFSLIFYKKS